jgi:hypothetical protein
MNLGAPTPDTREIRLVLQQALRALGHCGYMGRSVQGNQVKPLAKYAVLLVMSAYATLAMSLGSALADNENWVLLGTAQDKDGSYLAYYDANGAPTPQQDPHTVFDVKGIVPNQDFYRHSVDPREVQSNVPDYEGGLVAATFTLGVDVDCPTRVVHEWHLIFQNEKGWWLADHDLKGVAIHPPGGTLGAILLQKICGS